MKRRSLLAGLIALPMAGISNSFAASWLKETAEDEPLWYIDHSPSEFANNRLGLFANTAFDQHDVIGYVIGAETQTDGEFVIWNGDGIGMLVENECKYLNHSSSPNCRITDSGAVVALRNINAAEELTHDYGW